jgi:peptidoglycan/LPS O-acetylase OafA/YrhL
MVHGPIIVFSRYFLLRDLQGLEIAAVVVASLVLAYLSWRFVETLFRHPRKPLPRPAMFAVAASALAGCIALGVAGAATDGYRSRFPALQASRHPIAAVDSWLNGKCFLENQDASVWAGDVCTRTAGASRTALLWGDSFAAHYIPGLGCVDGIPDMHF